MVFLYRPSWPQTCQSSCVDLQRVVITGLWHQAQLQCFVYHVNVCQITESGTVGVEGV